MMAIKFIPSLAISPSLLERGSLSIALLILVLSIVAVRSGSKLYKSGGKFNSRQWKYLLVLTLLVLPANFLLSLQLFDNLGTGSPSLSLLFMLLPSLTAVGLLGFIPAAALAGLSGIIQVLTLQQNMFTPLILIATVLVFAWFSSRVEWEGSQRTQFSPFVNVLLAFGCVTPLIFLVTLVSALAAGSRDLIRILQSTLVLIFSMLPAVLLGALAVQALQRWLPKEWIPLRFVRENVVASSNKLVIEQINRLSQGNFEQMATFESSSGKEAQLFKALEVLRQGLRQRNDTQSRLLSLDPSYYSREAYDLLLASILRAALGRDASSARLILVQKSKEDGSSEMRLRIGQGEKTRHYAYLDIKILEKIGAQDQLILSDLKVDQYFGLSSGMPYPQSIAALQLRHEGNTQGVLWVGFEDVHWFSQDDIRFYEQLAFRASAALRTKEQYAEIQAEKNWLRSTVEAMPEPLFVVDQSGAIVLINKAAEALMPMVPGNAQSAASKLATALFDPHMLLAKAMEETSEKVLTVVNGSEYEAYAHPLGNGDEQAGHLLILHDTSSLRKLNEQKNEFVTNISHELRTPLSYMRGYITLLQNIGNLSEEQQKYVSRIQQNIDNMSGLVRKVLKLELLDAGEAVIYTSFDVKQMVDETVTSLSLLAQQRKVAINCDYTGLKSTKLLADRILLQQALFNLIENAVKFSALHSEVGVAVSKDGGWLHFIVTDHGKGIAPLDQAKVFTRFFHVDDDANADTHGQGLGLAIVKSIAERHGGTIRLESHLGEGSTFFLDIPIRKQGTERSDKLV